MSSFCPSFLCNVPKTSPAVLPYYVLLDKQNLYPGDEGGWSNFPRITTKEGDTLAVKVDHWNIEVTSPPFLFFLFSVSWTSNRTFFSTIHSSLREKQPWKTLQGSFLSSEVDILDHFRIYFYYTPTDVFSQGRLEGIYRFRPSLQCNFKVSSVLSDSFGSEETGVRLYRFLDSEPILIQLDWIGY